MPERDIAAEVLKGLQEVREHRAGKRTFRETRIEATPLPELDPEMIEKIRENLEGSEEAVSHLLPAPVARASAPDRSGTNGKFGIDLFTERMKELDALRDADEMKTGVVDSIRPEHADEWPTELDASVRNVLAAAGAGQPYRHQFDAVRRSLHGADVVLESPTASGKTIAFTAPILHDLKRNPGSYALMIYPMKALAFDQRAQIQKLCQPLNIETWFFDGDTDTESRKILKTSPPPILMTNPELLNMSFLGWKEQWAKFLKNLRYVVIDEMHEYRGFFGGNMALLLRRFFLHLDRIGASPKLFLSTATCENPREHARNLTGREVEAVSARDVLRPRRHFMFVNPGIPDFKYWDILQQRVEQAALAVLTQGLQALVFCPTKKFLEDAYRRCVAKAKKLELDPKAISPFHADLKSDDRQGIQQRIKAGDINVVFTTNALELGLDIGGMDGVILAGFPASIMSAWQQIGRAGRGWDKDAFVLFYAMNDPIDRFFVGNLNAFLNKPLDELVVDPNNEELIERHLGPLAYDADGDLLASDRDILGEAFYDAARKGMGTPITGSYRPHAALNMRGNFGQSYALKKGAEELGQISTMRRFREAYIGAVFTFFGRKYRVHSHEANAVVLTDVEPYLKTDARFFTVLTTKDIFDGYRYGEFAIYYGSLNVVMNFTGYKLVDERNGNPIEGGAGGEAHYQNNLHAFWINSSQSDDVGIGALEHLIRVGAMFVIPADRFDASTHSKTGGEPTASYYENYSGGIGVARKLFDVWPTALRKGIEVAENCQCRSGCPNCIEPAKSYNISNAAIDKARGVPLANELLTSFEQGPDSRFRNGRMVTV